MRTHVRAGHRSKGCAVSRGDQQLRFNDWFCGAGGATQGAHAVPGIEPVLAANHDKLAIETHSTNFPGVEHFCGDIQDLDIARHPYAEIFWASPECTNWSAAKGRKADYAAHPGLFDNPEPEDGVVRSRALMQDVVRYLRGMDTRHQPILAGIVENVIDIRKWIHWDHWLAGIETLGYRTRLIALNSAHAASHRTPRAPQSRDRLYLAYWHQSLGRDPDWDRWLRPECRCASCEQTVQGIQTWKRPSQDMGRYGSQYYYRCPNTDCHGARAEPFYLPAATAIDWTIPGQRIGDRDRPLSPKTMTRIQAALKKWKPTITETTTARNTDDLLPISTTALLVPVEGREGKQAMPTDRPLRTQTTRNDLALLTMPHNPLMPYYGASRPGTPTDQTMGTPTTACHQSLLEPPQTDIMDCLFRMLEPHEIGAGMAFLPDYVVCGSKRQQVRQYGNAVTPPVAEILVSALAECVQGHDIDWTHPSQVT